MLRLLRNKSKRLVRVSNISFRRLILNKEFLLQTTKYTVIYVAGVYGFTEYIGSIVKCEGPSMLPTLQQHGDFLLVDKWSIKCHKLRLNKQANPLQDTTREGSGGYPLSQLSENGKYGIHVGDVIVAINPIKNSTRICKRVIGMGGDWVRISTGSYFYPREKIIQTPSGYIWLQGDNLQNSNDSRNYGPVPIESIEGIVRAKISFNYGRAKNDISFVNSIRFTGHSDTGHSDTGHSDTEPQTELTKEIQKYSNELTDK